MGRFRGSMVLCGRAAELGRSASGAEGMVTGMGVCKCECGQPTKGTRVFVNKEHQLRWMVAGGASQMNALQPVEAKQRGGHTAGTTLAATGQLAEASKKGAAAVRAITEQFRARRSGEASDAEPNAAADPAAGSDSRDEGAERPGR